MPSELNSPNLEKEVAARKGTVLVEFYTESCGPCRQVAATLDELAQEKGTSLKIVKIDAAQNQELAARFRVSAVPAFVVFKNGEPEKRFLGVKSKKDLRAWIAS